MLRQLCIILLLFQICRLLFFIVNYSFFYPLKTEYAVNSFFYGIQYDLSAIVKYNSFYILGVLIPPAILFQKTYYKTLINTIFISLNSLAIFLLVSDIEYFRFSNKRTTYEFIYYLQTMQTEMLRLIPAYIIQYWYLFIIVIAMIFIISRIRFVKNYSNGISLKEASPRRKFILLGLVLLFLGVLVRGIAKSELKSSDCERITPVEYNSLITNTPFVLIEYYLRDKHTNIRFDKLKPYYTERKYISSAQFRPLNVVIIILESFSKEYIGSLNGNKGATPFLDSLIKQSYICSSAYANGRTTLQALPAMLCSEPSLGELPVAFTMDRKRNLNSIAEILSMEGYGTAFFYGARNGNLGINNFAREEGFRSYYGMNEYTTKSQVSAWGVFDDEFLPFAAKTMNTFREPFISCVLTLSSHSPFEIPKKFDDKFREQPNSQLRSIAYTDYSLAQFFHQVSHYSWYSNTLFVISADHASYSYSARYNSKTGTFAIPILYFCPSDALLEGNYDSVTQQCDIMPSILDYLHYNGKFESVGNSIFSHSEEHFAVMKLQNQCQYITDGFFIDMSENGSLKNAFKMKNNEFLFDNLPVSGNKKLEAKIVELQALVNYSLK
jgi:phosphoglycerol transferase MdoB-like AlkP superfamily enzyme